MIGMVYSKQDPVGSNMIEHLLAANEFEKVEGQQYLKYRSDEMSIYEVDVPSYRADFADDFGCDTIVFLNRHSSEAGISAFTTHSAGNWRDSADLGGKPRQLSVAAPDFMLAALNEINKIGENASKSYEATHHGPLLKTPSLFVELGGSESMKASKEAAAKVADATLAAVSNALDNELEIKKTAIGIGSNHYPSKFTDLALTEGYAFSHIMPKYAIFNEDGSSNLDVVEQTLDHSSIKPEIAVLDWKSLNSAMKEETIKKLNEIGLDNEKV